MKKDIILAGVGGQGILTIAAIIGTAAVESDLNVKQAEVHGMSQRGGAVQSHLRLSSNEIASDLIPEGKADLIIAVEPMEALRYLPMLSSEGWLISSNKAFVNIPDYPDIDHLMAEMEKLPFHVTLDADTIAKEIGSIRAANMVILGAAIPFLGITFDKLEKAVQIIFGRKGENVVKTNIEALKAGMAHTERIQISRLKV